MHATDEKFSGEEHWSEKSGWHERRRQRWKRNNLEACANAPRFLAAPSGRAAAEEERTTAPAHSAGLDGLDERSLPGQRFALLLR